jgi:hypothetical protein
MQNDSQVLLIYRLTSDDIAAPITGKQIQEALDRIFAQGSTMMCSAWPEQRGTSASDYLAKRIGQACADESYYCFLAALTKASSYSWEDEAEGQRYTLSDLQCLNRLHLTKIHALNVPKSCLPVQYLYPDTRKVDNIVIWRDIVEEEYYDNV